jgi:hypothetical protein
MYQVIASSTGCCSLNRGSVRAALSLPQKQRRAAQVVKAMATSEDSSSSKDSAKSSGVEKIYVGKGRFIEDVPDKYPDRNALTGGFAGGEVRLDVSLVSPMYL